MANKSKSNFYNGYSDHSSSSLTPAPVDLTRSVTGHCSSSPQGAAAGGAQSKTGHNSSSLTPASGAGCGTQSVTGPSSSLHDQQQSSTAVIPVTSQVSLKSKSSKVPGATGGLTSSVLVGQKDERKCKAAPGPPCHTGLSTHGEQQYNTQLGINVRIYSGDISRSTADAITTSEGCQVNQKSQVTRSISNLPGSRFEERREKLFSFHGGQLQEGKVYVTQILVTYPVKYRYVLHAVFDSTTKDDMSDLYWKVFEESDKLNVNTVAVPLLGSGRGGIKAEDAVRDLAYGLHNYATKRPKLYITRHLNVEIVTLDVKIVDMIYKEIEKIFNSPSESVSGLERCTSMSKTTPKKQPQSPGADISEWRNETLTANAHQHPDGSKTHKTVPQLRLYRSTTIRNGAMVAASEMTSLEARTADLSLSSDITGRKDLGRRGDSNARTSALGYRGQYNDFDLQSSSPDVEDDLDEGNRVSPEKQPEPKSTDVGSYEDETCPICMDVIQNLKVLDKCGHKFCKECIEDSFRRYKPVCPSCLTVYDIITGNMPCGRMNVHRAPYPSLPGYEGSGIITIEYHFPNGTQTKDHPHPGRGYHGTSRVAFLPNNSEGEKVYKLLKLAFDRKLTFTVGRSATTGRDDVVTWNDIHHKTSIDGGPTRFGYPDETYLSRVQEELASKGVTVDQL